MVSTIEKYHCTAKLHYDTFHYAYDYYTACDTDYSVTVDVNL